MKDYYEILGLKSEASKNEIKRAYFKLVRKYPPDRYEAEFMEIREAYETLINEKTREQYDSINSIPNYMKNGYNSARVLIEEDDLIGGIKVLEEMLKADPKLIIVKSLLAETYLKNYNTGKALKMYEELVASEPENAAFAGYLANSYLARGWHNKAIAAYDRAIEIDSDNISLWMGLSETYIKKHDYWKAKNVLEKALDLVKDAENNTTIYLRLIMVDIDFGIVTSIYKYLDKLTELTLNNDEVKDNVAWTLSHIAKYLLHIERLDEAKSVIDRAAEILPEDGDILQTKNEIQKFKQYIKEFDKLDKDKKIKMEVTGLIAFEVLPNSILQVEEEEKKSMAYFYENEMLNKYEKYKDSIKRLERYYPELYAVKSEFFNKVSNSIERRKTKLHYEKQFDNYKHIMKTIFDIEEDEYEEYDDWDNDYYDDYEIQEPYVREEPKIGRNDPCPCGSGKKYKKCCGKK